MRLIGAGGKAARTEIWLALALQGCSAATDHGPDPWRISPHRHQVAGEDRNSPRTAQEERMHRALLYSESKLPVR